MRILHYSLGFPPYRTGGLTKYCTDLMLEQVEQGNEVSLLWPGEIRILAEKTKIKNRKKWNGIGSFEIINPLPVPLDEGIADIDVYTKAVDEGIYEEFLKAQKLDAIHIHSLMGLHKEFLMAAHKLGIRTVFTSHDYFGICPKVTLYHDGVVCDNDHHCSDCVQCNQTALSLKKIMVLQSPIYRKVKNTAIVKAMRKRHRQEFFDDAADTKNEAVETGNVASDYIRLRQYYVSMLEMVDIIHFNSSVSKKVYERYIHPKNSVVLPITHRDIRDHRHRKDFHHERLRITYLGPAKPFKGFQFLIGVLDQIWDEGSQNFELHLYSETSVSRPYITHKQNGYPYSQLEEIFDATDLLVVPSQWYETFGFTVLEALSYGVPILVGDKVGAQDLINKEFLFRSEDEIEEKIKRLSENREMLIDENACIIEEKRYPFNMDSQVLY
jgi:glycosyltransferase involved in cell wall biosynthesis